MSCRRLQLIRCLARVGTALNGLPVSSSVFDDEVYTKGPTVVVGPGHKFGWEAIAAVFSGEAPRV